MPQILRKSDGKETNGTAAGVLHTIFFHRYFPSIRPSLYTPTSAVSYSSSRSQESLPVPLPAIHEPVEISAAIDAHAAALVSQLTSSSSNAGTNGSRGEIVVQLFDRKRRKTGITGGWLGRLGGTHQTEEEVCWEEWVVQVVVARPRTEAGELSRYLLRTCADVVIGRSNKGSAGHGDFSAKSCHEDRGYCQQRQGPYPAHPD